VRELVCVCLCVCVCVCVCVCINRFLHMSLEEAAVKAVIAADGLVQKKRCLLTSVSTSLLLLQ